MSLMDSILWRMERLHGCQAELERLRVDNAEAWRQADTPLACLVQWEERLEAAIQRADQAEAREAKLRAALESVWRHHGCTPPDGCKTCDTRIADALAETAP